MASSSSSSSSSLFLILVLLLPLQLIKCQNTQIDGDDLAVAIQEMKRANYFTFVTLINMWSPHSALINATASGSITFFMPKDRALSDYNNLTTTTNNSISDFVLRHSVPSALLFHHLLRLPTASLLPTSLPHSMLHIRNGGSRSNFFLNNISLLSPNLCTATSTIRCHGIAAVLPTFQQDTTSSSCSSSSSSTNPPSSSPSPSPSLPSPNSEIINNAAPAAAPSPSHPRKSASSTTSKCFLESCILLCFSIIIYAM